MNEPTSCSQIRLSTERSDALLLLITLMIALFVPEMSVLRKVAHMRVNAVFTAMVAAGILPTQAFGTVL